MKLLLRWFRPFAIVKCKVSLFVNKDRKTTFFQFAFTFGRLVAFFQLRSHSFFTEMYATEIVT